MTTQAMTMTFVATGANRGRTFTYRANQQSREYAFVDGQFRITAKPEVLQTLSRYLAASVAAYPMGSDDLERALRRQEDGELRDAKGAGDRKAEEVRGGVQHEGRGAASRLFGDGSRHAGAGAGQAGVDAARDGLRAAPAADRGAEEAVTRIQTAVRALDPSVPEFWTDAGLPSLSAVCKALGDEGVTRAQIAAAMPNFTREVARLS